MEKIGLEIHSFDENESQMREMRIEPKIFIDLSFPDLIMNEYSFRLKSEGGSYQYAREE
jgi:hypothetical protein